MDIIEIAKRVFEVESREVLFVSTKINRSFSDAVEAIYTCKGRLVISGVGKSGLIGKKISATLASTGTPSFFIHPTEAIHGDLGMITRDDIILSISNSGETPEIIQLIPSLKRFGILHITMVGNPISTLGINSNICIDVGINEEACKLKLAPTSSTTASMVMGDAIAVALMEKRNFKTEDFAIFHPGGSLGRLLLSKAEDEMVQNPLPRISKKQNLKETILVMSQGGIGICICEDIERGIGIFTDGDLRRYLNQISVIDLSLTPVEELINWNPVCIPQDMMISEAEYIMEQRSINSLICTHHNAVTGILIRMNKRRTNK